MKNVPLIIAILTLITSAAISNAQTVAKDTSASISGRITSGGKGVADITVVAATTSPSYEMRGVSKAITDVEGNYLIAGLSPGRFTVIPVAKAYAISSSGAGRAQPNPTVNVLAGEEITRIDFDLTPGGVITGRITDADGSPIIGERVAVLPIDPQHTARIVTSFDGSGGTTDDRGIYRTYGLAPGKYKVSVGQTTPQGSNLMKRGSQYMRTFYPGVQDESKATVIEIKGGSEVKDVDIKTTKGARGFSANGRVVDSTGQPMPNVFVGYALIDDSHKGSGGMAFSPSPTDGNGKFNFDGLQAGHYTAFTIGVAPGNTTYSEPAKFEIVDADVKGIEIKLGQGATISGFVIVENSADPAVAAVLPTISLYAYSEHKPGSAPSFSQSKVNADGSFKLAGLAPGKVRLAVEGYPSAPKGLNLLRTELNGVEQRDGIEVTAGAEINDVRLVFSYGVGTLRGTIKVAGGTVPEGTMFWAMLSSGSDNTRGFRGHSEVDSRGRFTMEGIPPGTYELIIRATLGQLAFPNFTPVRQTISVTHGVETQVTVEVDLAARKERPQ